MSLTSHLRQADSPVRRFLFERFPKTRPVVADVRAAVVGAATIRPPVPVPWSLLGTAVDYRVRGYFGPVSFAGIPEAGAQLLWGPDEGFEFYAEAGSALDARARELGSVGRRLDREQEEWLARFCLVLSLFEVVFRSGTQPPEIASLSPDTVTPDQLLAIPQQAWVDDLCALSWAFYDQHADLLSKPAILHPTFDGSGDVGGADADLVLDGCLLEIKATIHVQRVDPLWLYQLLGYTLLDYSDRLGINAVGIYFARQTRLVRWPLDELMKTMAGTDLPSLTELRADFQRAAKSTAR